MILALMGATVTLETLTDKGRIDAVLEFDEIIYIIELKKGAPEDGMKQIKKRRYWEAYSGSGKKIILLSVGGFEQKDIRHVSETFSFPDFP